MDQRIGVGTSVLLWLDNRRKWLVEVAEDKEFHTHKGIVQLGELVGKQFGDKVVTSRGNTMYLLRPSLCDRLAFFERPTQILYPKDIGLLLLRLGLESGMNVVEAGTGSGVVTAAIANTVKPQGHVYSYDINLEFIRKAEQNLAKTGLLQYVTLRCSDAREGFTEFDVDAVFLDLGDPWSVVPQAHSCLKGGSNLASFSPTLNQVEKTVAALRREGFVDIETCELFLRNMRIEEGRSRPESRMISHTGYLTFARKVRREVAKTGNAAAHCNKESRV
ncbi:tRNA (adenine-N1)-methyltransferase [Candidatus Bathyarchaeota archaeon]|nr:tRNA (adenine-N1)-methyltransferase [Candidatus Bathyarchaeota archaeon]